jgi:hypothetical protein
MSKPTLSAAKNPVAQMLARTFGDSGAMATIDAAPVGAMMKTQITVNASIVNRPDQAAEAALPQPPRRFVADVAKVLARHGDVRFVFGQENVLGSALETALVVRMCPPAAQELLNDLNAMSDPTLLEIAKGIRIAAAPTYMLAKAERTVNVIANGTAVAVSGHETAIDFFHASPFSMAASKQANGQEIAVPAEAIVRVDLHTAGLLTLVEELRAVVQELTSAASGVGND